MSTHEPPTATSPSAELRLGRASEPDADRWQAIADRAKRLYGAVPETLRIMAIGSNAAELYLALSEANDDSALSTLEREYVAIQTARSNGCHYSSPPTSRGRCASAPIPTPSTDSVATRSALGPTLSWPSPHPCSTEEGPFPTR
jgi:hypothetical protein